jgi:hypothetical protein
MYPCACAPLKCACVPARQGVRAPSGALVSQPALSQPALSQPALSQPALSQPASAASISARLCLPTEAPSHSPREKVLQGNASLCWVFLGADSEAGLDPARLERLAGALDRCPAHRVTRIRVDSEYSSAGWQPAESATGSPRRAQPDAV